MAAILAFAGSNSSTSINYRLVKYTTSLIRDHSVKLLNMAHLPFPMYSVDLEREKGFPDSLVELKEDFQRTDGLILSVNEHNSNPSAYFKNLIDWLSRLERKFLLGKPVFLMSTSGGARGAATSLGIVEQTLPRFGTKDIITFSLPHFHDNLDASRGIVDQALAEDHRKKLEAFLSNL